MTKVYDVFTFFNEINLLEIRLESLDPFVDYFLITESTTTFSGLPKPSYFLENEWRFEKFKSKIIHQVVDNVPSGLSHFQRDWYQRDAAKVILAENLNSNDLIIYGDVDEIPSESALSRLETSNFTKSPVMHCAQDLFYYYLNLKDVSGKFLAYSGEYPGIWKKKWLGTVFTNPNHLENFSMTQLRDPAQKRFGTRIRNGGWHFSYCGSPTPMSAEDRIKNKILSAAHQEYNTDEVLSQISQRVEHQKDVFGRGTQKFKPISDLSKLPKYIYENQAKFADIILI